MVFRRLVSVGTFPLLLIACGGASSGGNTPSDVKCPEGQTYDGEFCQVDQSVATAEQAVPPEETTAKTPTGAEEVQAEEQETGVGEGGEQEVAPEALPEETAEASQAPPKREHATAVDVTMAAQAAPLIQYMAGAHLPAGARQFGAPFAGQFAEGQILERKVQLTQGKCYTFMAAGLPPVAEVDVELFVEGEEEPVAKDATVGLQAVLGSRNECFTPAKTGPYTLVLSVARGQGVAAAQVFQK